MCNILLIVLGEVLLGLIAWRLFFVSPEEKICKLAYSYCRPSGESYSPGDIVSIKTVNGVEIKTGNGTMWARVKRTIDAETVEVEWLD